MIPLDRFNADGSLKIYTAPEIAAMQIRTRGIRDGSSPTRTYSPNTNSFTATYFVRPESHEAFKCLALGAVTVYFDAGLGTDALSRLMPLIFPGTEKTICTQMRSKGFKFVEDDTTGRVKVPKYYAEEWELTFEVPRFNLADDPPTSERARYVEEVPGDSTAEYLSLPGIGLKFFTPLAAPPNNVPIPYNVGLPMVGQELGLKWWRIPKAAISSTSTLFARVFGDPDTGDIPYLGTVNSTGGSGFFGYPQGTLLFQKFQKEVVFDQVAEDFCYNLTYWFKHIPNGCNFLFYPGTAGVAAGWYFTGRTGYFTSDVLPDGEAIYNTRDAKNLFKVG